MVNVPYFQKNKEEKPPQIERRPQADRYTVKIYADMLKISAPGENCTVTRQNNTRGKITQFSPRSRKRLIECLASELDTPDIFLTLTYDDETATMDKETLALHFERFRERLKYVYPGVRAIWRLEIETRKSGGRTGEPLPHYHLLIWLPEDAPEWHPAFWRQAWTRCVESSNYWHEAKYGAKSRRVNSRRHAYMYVSKYIAKTSDEQHEVGRRWGTIGEVGSCEFFECEITQKQYIELKRLIAAFLRSVGSKFAKRIPSFSPKYGMTALGLGVIQQTDYSPFLSTAYWMIQHAIDIAREKG